MIEKLIRNNPDSVLICDKENLKFLEVNEIAINLYGYTREEFMQMDLTDLYSTEDIQLLLESSSANIREGSFHGPYKHKRKDGSTILVEISRYSIKYREREAHFNLVRDITSKLETEKINKAYKTVYENTDDMIFITDSSGLIQSVNSQVTKILGYTKNDLLSTSFLSITSDEDRSKVRHELFELNEKLKSSALLELKTVNGQYLNAEVISTPISVFNNEIEWYIIIVKSKSALILSSASGDANQLKNLNQSSHPANEIDSKYLAELFHDLLTSVNVILGFAQEITDSLEQPTSEQREASKIIKQNRTNLLQSMNAAIEYASLTEKDLKLEINETRMTDIIDSMAYDLDEFQRTEGIELAYGKISSSLTYKTDKQRFKYFLLLVFKTVAKISKQKSIYLSAYAQDDENFLVTFKDLHTKSSQKLVRNLKSIFAAEANDLVKDLGFSKIHVNLVQQLLKLLKGKFIITSQDNEQYDYGIIFPINFEIISTYKKKEPMSSENLDASDKSKGNFKKSPQIDADLRNELRLEALREQIRKKEEAKSTNAVDESAEQIIEENIEDTRSVHQIEYYDLDLQENSHKPIEPDEIAVIKTSGPVEKPKAPPTVKNPDDKIDISGLSCLYLEDQIDSQVLYSVQMKGLKNLNFAVSFEECLPLLESGHFDFIVIDINLQGSYNGLDILRIIRSMPRYENIPVFAVTAYVLPGDKQKFVLAGFNGFISKPIFRSDMIELLSEVFKEL